MKIKLQCLKLYSSLYCVRDDKNLAKELDWVLEKAKRHRDATKDNAEKKSCDSKSILLPFYDRGRRKF